jgi:hypothetical protein
MCHPKESCRKAIAYTSECCCGHPGFVRHFISKKERRESLKEYKDMLKKELEGVEEHLKELGS